ncbi:MAG: NADP-dependent isocitrate dehydrogenase, partial [Thalassolituus sp.]|nr:NADP-dependent isocitrate dehydrogenase [Thalassolituus sp.]
MSANESRIIYTETDEAPALATHSLLPIIQAFSRSAGIDVETRDISLAGRILANFPEFLQKEQRIPDDLAELGTLAGQPEANIIKLPNISASLPQLREAIKELRSMGFDVPLYPSNPATDEDRDVQARYDRIKGSAVNPVLREGNSDRRAPASVKEYARSYPHSMGEWSSDSQSSVAHMDEGDFYGSEQSMTMTEADVVDIEFIDTEGNVTPLKEGLKLLGGEVIDASVMRAASLRAFLDRAIQEAKDKGVLFSVHLKATMMKVSDPVLFGHAVTVFFRDVFEKHADTFAQLGVDANNGLGDVVTKIASLPADQKATIEADIQACMDAGPDLYMVNSDKGITNLHVPSDVIIDASMPSIIRSGGKGWGQDGEEGDTKCV